MARMKQAVPDRREMLSKPQDYSLSGSSSSGSGAGDSADAGGVTRGAGDLVGFSFAGSGCAGAGPLDVPGAVFCCLPFFLSVVAPPLYMQPGRGDGFML